MLLKEFLTKTHGKIWKMTKGLVNEFFHQLSERTMLLTKKRRVLHR